MKIPTLGIVENMSFFQCPSCDHISHIFSHGGGSRLASTNDLSCLAQLPLDVSYRESMSQGVPCLISDDNVWRKMARNVFGQLSLQSRDSA